MSLIKFFIDIPDMKVIMIPGPTANGTPLTNCWSKRLTPQVANNVSNGLPYNFLIINLSRSIPTHALKINATKIETIIYMPEKGFKRGVLNTSWVTNVEYAPTIISSPWARFITPIKPKTIAKPRAAISRTEPIEIPSKRMSKNRST